MKRLRLWLQELSLIQQLCSILFLFVLAFALFILFFLTPSIDSFTRSEMYNRLHEVQVSLISYGEVDTSSKTEITVANTEITVLLYDTQSGKLITVTGNEPSDLLRDAIKADTTVYTGTYDTVYTVKDPDNLRKTYILSRQWVNEESELIAYMPNDYQLQLRTTLVRDIFSVNLFYVAALLLILMVWIANLIYPLRQIRTYISKLRLDEPAELKIQRRDEIGDVARALTDMQEELSRQTREKQEMIQNISHDLKTPVATIKSYSEAIKDGIYPYDTLEKSIDVIIEHADRLENKVKSLIVLNKMEYLQDSAEEGDHLCMNDVIDKVVLSLKVIRPEISLIKMYDQKIYFHGEEEPWRIVVENLVDNALRYARTEIRIVLNPGELCVENDGELIKEEDRKKIFRPYEKGTNGKFGLGLSIVYRVATTYGYHVEAENISGGVRFRISKPVEKQTRERRQKQKVSKK